MSTPHWWRASRGRKTAVRRTRSVLWRDDGRPHAGGGRPCVKDAAVSLVGIRVAVGLGGRAFFVVHGQQHDVEASVAAGSAVLEASATLHRTEVIARPHAEMVPWLLRTAPFKLGDL